MRAGWAIAVLVVAVVTVGVLTATESSHDVEVQKGAAVLQIVITPSEKRPVVKTGSVTHTADEFVAVSCTGDLYGVGDCSMNTDGELVRPKDHKDAPGTLVFPVAPNVSEIVRAHVASPGCVCYGNRCYCN